MSLHYFAPIGCRVASPALCIRIRSFTSNKVRIYNQPGIRDEDIIVYDPTSDSWSLLFDGSDVGLGNVDVDGFAFRNGEYVDAYSMARIK